MRAEVAERIVDKSAEIGRASSSVGQTPVCAGFKYSPSPIEPRQEIRTQDSLGSAGRFIRRRPEP